MTRIMHGTIAALLALGMIGTFSRLVDAGRLGGPASEIFTVQPFQTLDVDVWFVSGRRGVITVEGNGAAALDLYVYDGDGHAWTGTGRGDHKTVYLNVYKAGIFRIEIRNLGPWSNTCVISTN